jgi:hypothetical protein
LSDVFSVVFQQVVSDKSHRALPFQLVPHLFSVKTTLQLIEAERL